MKYDKMIFSAVVLTVLNTGCVKPTEEVNSGKSSDATVYDEQPNSVVYEDTQPIVYSDPTTTSSSGDIYGSTSSSADSTVITPTSTGSYQQISTSTPNSTDHYQPTGGGGSYASSSGSGGAYDDPYSSGGGGGGYNPVDDPYASSSGSSTSSSTYSTNIPYGSSSSTPSYSSSGSSTHKGIQLQVAALRDYYAAEEFRKGLSLDPKYSSYVKKGAMNKVIISGIPTRAEAKALAARQFPGAFIVGGYETSSSYSGGGSSYTAPTSYTPSYSSSSSGNTNSGIGVQVGAFSSKSKARAIAQEKAGGQYTAIVKTVKVRGRTMYKAILLGFSSRADAKRAIASGRFGDAFVVSGIHP